MPASTSLTRAATDRGVAQARSSAAAPQRGADPGDSRAWLAAIVLLATGVILSFWRLHADNNDAALYTLLARRLVVERTPFLLHFPPVLLERPPFYEHPPLWIWIQALALTLTPDFDLRLLGALCGVGTVAAAFVLGRELIGVRASFLGCALLVATESFSNYQPLARLDPPLTFTFTASVALLVLARGRLPLLFVGGLVAGLGSLVKGPPALGAPVVAALLLAAMGRGDVLRRPSSWIAAGLGTILLPGAFLVHDHVFLGGAWWKRYVLSQVLESAAGARRGNQGWFALLKVNVWRFWPGLPFVVIAIFRAAVARRFPLEQGCAGRVRAALLCWTAIIFAGFASSGRSYWWYLMPAYVPMALLAGAGAEDLLPARARAVDRSRTVILALGAVLIALLPLKVLGRLERPCPFGDLPEMARQLAHGGPVAIVRPDYSTRVIFGEHCRCEPVVVQDPLAATRVGLTVALLASSETVPDGWHRIANHGAWSLIGQR